MKHRTIRNTAIALLAIAAIGASVGNSALTINSSYGPSAVATELRALSFTDWATANTSGSLSTSIGIFNNNDLSDDTVPFMSFLNPGSSVRIEELYSSAGYTNELRIELGNTLLMSSKPGSNSEGVLITADSPSDTLEKLVFKTNTAGGFDPTAAGDVYLYDNSNLRTYVLNSGQTTHFIWALEDIHKDARRNDNDFNDYLFYAQISAVPEPSTVITIIAVGFLGLTILRRRFSKTGTAA
jgi:hypothetical protein